MINTFKSSATIHLYQITFLPEMELLVYHNDIHHLAALFVYHLSERHQHMPYRAQKVKRMEFSTY